MNDPGATPPSRPDEGPGRGPSPDAIHTQLVRILASPEFQATDRIRDFLRFVVEETLAGRSEQLKGYTIATEVFGRGEDFDAALDPVVRVQARKLRRALERYYLVAGQRDEVVIDVPKGRYVPTFRQRVAAPDRDTGDVAEAFVPVSLAGPVVAVMPLEDLTGRIDQSFFAIGLGEDLVTELNRFQDLVVIPCQRAKGGAAGRFDMDEVCRETGAGFVLGGTVRRDEESAKVSVRLLDAKTGRQVWARSFKHGLEAGDLIRTQEEIANSVVAAIGSDYGVISQRLAADSRKKPPTELSTYEAMLRYSTYQITPSPEASEACFAALRSAVEREPEYGPAWSALATLYCQMYVFDVHGFDNPLGTGLDYANRGVALEPVRQLSRLALAYASLLGDAFDTFRAEAETTLILNPNNPYAVGTIGYMFVLNGEFDRGRALLTHATAANPYHPQWFYDAFYLDRFHHDDHQGALAALKPRSRGDIWYATMAAAVLGMLGRGKEAEEQAEILVDIKPDFLMRGRELMERTIKVTSLVDKVIEGLRRAGLEIK
jgi:adenylate cyclase